MGLYKGYFISAAGVVPYFAVTLAAYDEMKVGLLEGEGTQRVELMKPQISAVDQRTDSGCTAAASLLLLLCCSDCIL